MFYNSKEEMAILGLYFLNEFEKRYNFESLKIMFLVGRVCRYLWEYFKAKINLFKGIKYEGEYYF